MSLLEKIHNGKRKTPPRICHFADPGTGKSTWSAKAPNPIFIPLENGLDQIDCKSLPHCRSWAELIEDLDLILNEQHDFQTLVIDSLTSVQDFISDRVCADGKSKFLTAAYGGFNRGNDAAEVIFRSEIIKRLDDIRSKKNMCILLLAHAHDEMYRRADGTQMKRTAPKLISPIKDLVYNWCDVVAYSKIKTIEDAMGNHIIVGPNGGDRETYVVGHTHLMAKNRYDIGAEPLPFAWSALADAIAKGSAADGGAQG